jgi:multidrug efflux pump subunit AcrB
MNTPNTHPVEKTPLDLQAEREAKRRRYQNKPLGASGRIAQAFQDSKLTPLLVLVALFIGVFATSITPREEEPQIVVPMVDIFVGAQGLSPVEVEQLVATPMEKLLWEIPGVDDVYTTSRAGMAMAILRFNVGEDEEDSLVKVYNKLNGNLDHLPPGVSPPLVRLKGIDDVPVFAVTLHSTEYDAFQLRRVAGELATEMKKIDDVAETTMMGGLRRQIRVELDPDRLKGYSLSPLQVFGALGRDNQNAQVGSFDRGDTNFLVRAGDFFRTTDDVANTLVAVYNGRPIRLAEVAKVLDGPEEPASYVFHRDGAGAGAGGQVGEEESAVTIAVAKRRGANATELTAKLAARVEALKGDLIVSGITATTTRDYGVSAAEKSDELIFHMMLATISVVALVWLFLGIKEAAVVLVAVPVTVALTLFASYFFGYTLNRVTLFALIFAIGILVDDAIVVVENIHRHFNQKWGPLSVVTPFAVDEVGNPTILATLTVIFALMPLAFVSGMMGPYMSPIPINASAAMLFSLLVAFIVTPWMTKRLLDFSEKFRAARGHAAASHDIHDDEAGALGRGYRRLVEPMVDRPWLRNVVLASVVAMLFGSMALVYVRAVKVKMLPHDNKSEFQVIIDTAEGTTLERTAAVAREVAAELVRDPTVRDVQLYVGTSGPINFNGLVRHYFLRQGPNVADIQVNLLEKHARAEKSHDIAKALRARIAGVGQRHNAVVSVAEVPPGPPVLSTMVAEVYGPDAAGQAQLARQVRDLFRASESIVDVDWYVEDAQAEFMLSVDKAKATMSGVAADHIVQTLGLSLYGRSAGLLPSDREREPVDVMVRNGRADRSSMTRLADIGVHSATGRLVPIRELVHQDARATDPNIYHKNLQRVVYVTGEVGGVGESPVYAILDVKPKIAALTAPDGGQVTQLFNGMPQATAGYTVKWDGEWQITYDVFRDMGIAFGIVLVLMYILVVAWFRSFTTPIIIMLPIPLTLVGILPGHALMGTYFTATSMIGFIALAGIIVRNSILLVDFIEQEIEAGTPLREAVLQAGAVRLRPIFLTAAALVVGGAVILLDPIFGGLAVSLIFGVVVSTLLTLVVIPLIYYVANAAPAGAKEVP